MDGASVTYAIPGAFLDYGESVQEKTGRNLVVAVDSANSSGSFGPVIIVPLGRPR